MRKMGIAILLLATVASGLALTPASAHPWGCAAVYTGVENSCTWPLGDTHSGGCVFVGNIHITWAGGEFFGSSASPTTECGSIGPPPVVVTALDPASSGSPVSAVIAGSDDLE